MPKTEVRSYFFEAKTHKKRELVCYVVGFTAHVNQFKYSIGRLQKQGYDVLAFEYDVSVLTLGDPMRLLDVLAYITEETDHRAKEYERVICMGVSLGAFIAFNVQRRLPDASVGIYATAGVVVSEAIFTMKAFEQVKDAFISNGWNAQKLGKIWKNIEIKENDELLKDKSLVIVNGKIDRIVNHRAATKQVLRWRQEGTRVRLYKKNLLGHTGTILWYIFNTDKMLKRALNHHNTH